MKKFKKNAYLFTISFVITSCIIGGFFGVCIAYENIAKIAHGEYRNAIDIKDGKLRFFDFEYNLTGG